MVDDEHVPEDPVKFLRSVGVLLALEQRDEDIVLPVVIQPILLLVDLIHLQNRRRLEGPQPPFHQRQKLILHLWREVLIGYFVIPQEEFLELAGVEVIDHLLYFSVEFLPKLFVGAFQAFHEVVHGQVVLRFYSVEVGVDGVEGLGDPGMAVPVMLLLPLDLG